MNSVASAPARSSARDVEMTMLKLARKVALAPMPVTTPPMRNRARLGGVVQADVTRIARPRMIVGIPALSRGRVGQLVVVVWTTMPTPKVRKIAAPVRAGDG